MAMLSSIDRVQVFVVNELKYNIFVRVCFFF